MTKTHKLRSFPSIRAILPALLLSGCAEEAVDTPTIEVEHLSAVEAAPKAAEHTFVVEDQLLSESAFDSLQWNASVGLGGGANGGSLSDREVYQSIEEHGWQDPRHHPLSTFAADVDSGSFSNARRFLEDGRLPPRDAVRVEEFINWFHYQGPNSNESVTGHPLAVATELFDCPWRDQHRLLRITLEAPCIQPEEIPPCNLVFLVDTSGSMRPDDKLPLLKRGLLLLAREMRAQDRISIVTYAGSSAIHLQPTSGAQRETIERAIQSLGSGGSTHGSAGIVDAYRLAREQMTDESVDRVMLATDGDFNVGITDRGQLIQLIEEQRESGVFLTVLGVGTGNLKDYSLEQLANHGNGAYAYIDSIAEARRVLVEQRASTLVTVAKDTKLQVEFNPRFVSRYRQVGYENRELAAEDFNDDRKDGGEIGAGHQVTALYEIVPVGVEPPVPAVDPLRYQPQPEAEAPLAADSAGSDELALVKIRYKRPDADRSHRFEVALQAEPVGQPSTDSRRAAAVAAFAMLLRESPHLAGDYRYAQVLDSLDEVDAPDPHGDWMAFRKLVTMARDLAATEPHQR